MKATSEQQAVLTKAVLRSAEQLGPTNLELGRALGVSRSTISRMAAGSYLLSDQGKEWELANSLVRLCGDLSTTLAGDVAAMAHWMRNTNTVLRAIPAERIQTFQGLVDVSQYVASRRAGN
jgi:DNA-binding XRE family transcriptional regulator